MRHSSKGDDELEETKKQYRSRWIKSDEDIYSQEGEWTHDPARARELALLDNN